jgi:hypothetical protein
MLARMNIAVFHDVSTVFYDVSPCSIVDIYQRLRGKISMMTEAPSTSETSVNFYHTTRRNILEESLQITK